MKVIQSCPTLCETTDCTVHGILQARILEWVVLPFSRGSSQPKDQPRSPVLQAGCLPAEPPGKPRKVWYPGFFNGFPAAPAPSHPCLWLQAPAPSLYWLRPPPSQHLWEHQPDSQTAPWTVSVLVASKCPTSSRSQGALPGTAWCSSQTPISPRAPGSPVTSLDPKMPRPVQGSCSSLGSSLRMRLIITVLPFTKTLVFTRCFRPTAALCPPSCGCHCCSAWPTSNSS